MNDATLPDLVIAVRQDASGISDAAYAEIVRRFEGMARAIGLRWLGDVQRAEDAAQEAFIEAYLTLGELREPEAFPGWFRRIVLKHCDRQLRRDRREQPLEAWLQLADGTHDVLDTLYLRERVSSALDSLTERQRTLTRMFYLDGYSQQEIVHQLHWPLSTVKKQLFLARNTLREEMADMAEITKTTGPSAGDLSLRVRFFLAVQKRDAAQIRKLVQAHHELLTAYTEWGDVENASYWPYGYGALHYAVGVDDLRLVDVLVDAGADVNGMTKHGFATPLHVAAMLGRLNMTERLLAAGANVGAANTHGQTALHFAAYRGYPDVLNALINARSAISLKDAGGRTPLDWALHRGHTAVAETLRKRGGEDTKHATIAIPEPDAASVVFETGIKAIDLFAPLARGAVNALFTPVGRIGKVAVLEQLIETVAQHYNGHTIYLGVESTQYTGTDFGAELEDIGLQDAASLFFVRGDNNAQAMPNVVAAALAKLDRSKEMLMMIDAAYAELPGLQAKIDATAGGSVTVLWFGNHSAGAEPEAFATVQALITFDLWRAANGYWPAIDPQHSRSTLVNGRQADLAKRAQRLLRRYEDLRIVVEHDPRGVDALETDADRLSVARARRLHAFLSQPFPIAELYTNTFGEYVPLAWGLDGLEAVLDGRADNVSEAALRVIAGMELYVRR